MALGAVLLTIVATIPRLLQSATTIFCEVVRMPSDLWRVSLVRRIWLHILLYSPKHHCGSGNWSRWISQGEQLSIRSIRRTFLEYKLQIMEIRSIRGWICQSDYEMFISSGKWFQTRSITTTINVDICRFRRRGIHVLEGSIGIWFIYSCLCGNWKRKIVIMLKTSYSDRENKLYLASFEDMSTIACWEVGTTNCAFFFGWSMDLSWHSIQLCPRTFVVSIAKEINPREKI